MAHPVGCSPEITLESSLASLVTARGINQLIYSSGLTSQTTQQL
jgi:hypothetical protein